MPCPACRASPRMTRPRRSPGFWWQEGQLNDDYGHRRRTPQEYLEPSRCRARLSWGRHLRTRACPRDQPAQSQDGPRSPGASWCCTRSTSRCCTCARCTWPPRVAPRCRRSRRWWQRCPGGRIFDPAHVATGAPRAVPGSAGQRAGHGGPAPGRGPDDRAPADHHAGFEHHVDVHAGFEHHSHDGKHQPRDGAQEPDRRAAADPGVDHPGQGQGRPGGQLHHRGLRRGRRTRTR